MQLSVDGTEQTFIPITTFTVAHALPERFGVAIFQPKNYAGLGSIDKAADELSDLRVIALRAIPEQVSAVDWLTTIPQIAAAFEAALIRANGAIRLHEEEIAFAVSNYGDICSAYGLALFRAAATGEGAPSFEAVYREWLFGTVRLGGEEEAYLHHGDIWRVWVIHHAYGRVGLKIATPAGVHYVLDKALACPAEGFMVGLLRMVGQRMLAATV